MKNRKRPITPKANEAALSVDPNIQNITGLDKRAIERLLTLADFACSGEMYDHFRDQTNEYEATNEYDRRLADFNARVDTDDF